MPYCSSPNDQTSLAAPVCSAPTMVPGWRIPWSRKTGEHAELEPADDQLPERRRGDVAVLEAADVSGPPRDARQADVETGGDLPAQVIEGRIDVTGPDEGAVALAASPRRPAQAEDLLFALAPHPVVETLGMQHRVDVADLGSGAEMVPEVLRLLGPQLGLTGVEPPGPDAVLVVPLPDLRPDVGAGPRAGRVVETHQRTAR